MERDASLYEYNSEIEHGLHRRVNKQVGIDKATRSS